MAAEPRLSDVGEFGLISRVTAGRRQPPARRPQERGQGSRQDGATAVRTKLVFERCCASSSNRATQRRLPPDGGSSRSAALKSAIACG